jgi:hypothetical protein
MATTDAPVIHPDEDLLAMAPPAERLADYLEEVELPFTLGVYGGWGEGKTSFARLVEKYLRDKPSWKDMRCVRFSAWPYTSSAAVWRALLLRIAREIYDVPDRLPEEDVKVSEKGWLPALGRFLNSIALSFRVTGDEDRGFARYRSLAARIDPAAAMIANRSGGIDQPSVMAAFASASLAVASSFAPWLGGVRGFFGWDKGVDVSGLGSSQSEPTGPGAVESVEEIRNELQAMFRHNADRRLLVLIDDLDRCMPSVALDVLEMVKIFFFESDVLKVSCLFVIAADQQLIGRGLRARLGEPEAAASGGFDLERKGKEYFEKIIQFGIQVPKKSRHQCHELIALHFPLWSCASDILCTVVDTNPRRLKQQCNLVAFKYLTARKAGSGLDRSDLAVFEKLVRIYALSRSCLDHTLKLARTKATYRQEMEDLENRFVSANTHEGQEIRHSEGWEGRPVECDHGRESLKAAFLGQPRLSQVLPRRVSIFAAFADHRPGREGFPESRDAVFVRIARITADEGGVIDFRQILSDNFAKLIAIERVIPKLLGPLVELARTPSYSGDLSAIDDYLDTRAQGSNGESPELSSFGERVLEALELKTVVSEPRKPQSSEIRDLVLTSPRLSHLPAGQVLAYDEIRLRLRETVSPADAIVASEDHRGRAAAVSALELMDAETSSDLELTIRLRCEVARGYLERRKYTKMQALDEGWPELSRRVGVDGVDVLRSLEKAILKPEETSESAPSGRPGWWEALQNDERFRRFLEIQPYFQFMSDQELGDFFAVADDLLGAGRAPELRPPAGGSNVVFAQEPFHDLSVRLEVRDDRLFVEVGSPTATEGPRFEKEAKIPFQEIEQLERKLRAIYLQAERPVQIARPTRDLAVLENPEGILRSLGEKLFDGICDDIAIRDALSKGLEQGGRRVRLVFECDHPDLSALSWESLYFAKMRVFLASTLRFSLVRYVSERRDLVFRSFEPPLRILAVLISPRRAPLPAAEKEGEVLRRTLAHAAAEGHVMLRIVSNANSEELRSELRRFHPQIIHFVGHGVIHDGVGHLLLEDDEGGDGGLLSAPEFGKTLRDSNVSLAILNACETGVAGRGDVLNGVAQAIVREGVPAAVATTRVILDSAALMFSREFYRALVDGYPLEGALVEARRVLDLKGWDWSAYALFAGSQDVLDKLRLLRYRSG